MQSRFIRPGFVIVVLAIVAMQGSWSTGAIGAQNDVETETFELGSFDSIRLQGAGNVVIQIGETPSVEVTADRRAMGFIEVSVENGVLSAGFPASLVFDVTGFSPISYLITTPSVSEIHLNGPFAATMDGLQADTLQLGLTTAATLTVTGLQAATLTAKLDLASTATLTGSVETQDVEVVNASTYDAADLDSASAQVMVSEASTATVRVRESLTGSVSTVSTLNYLGENVNVDVDTSLLGSVEQLPFEVLPGTPVASPAAAAPMTVDVAISQFLFEPASVEVAAGGTVTWTNLDALAHDVALLPPGSGFKSPLITKDGTYSFTVDEAGTFDYYCPSHPIMFGQVVVIDA